MEGLARAAVRTPSRVGDPGPARASSRRYAIVGALEDELRPLVDRTRVARRLTVGPCHLWQGRLSNAEVGLAATGDGRACARAGVEAVLARFPADLLIVVGVCGGLTPGLEPGALLVSRRVVQAGVDGPAPDPLRVERLLARGRRTPATFVTVDRVVRDAAAKLEVGSRLGGREPASVDLETAVYAAAAARAGLPWVGLRVVCDPAEETLPLDFNDCLDRWGRVSRSRVAARALMAPRTLPKLWSLRRRVRTGAEAVAAAVEELLCEERDG